MDPLLRVHKDDLEIGAVRTVKDEEHEAPPRRHHGKFACLCLFFLVGLFLVMLDLREDIRGVWHDFYCHQLPGDHCGEKRFSDFDPNTAEVLRCPLWQRVTDDAERIATYWCDPEDCLVSNHVIRCICQDPDSGNMKTMSMGASFASNDYCLEEEEEDDQLP